MSVLYHHFDCSYQHTKVKRNNPLDFYIFPLHFYPPHKLYIFINTGFQVLGREAYTEVNYFVCGCGCCPSRLKNQIFSRHLYLVSFSKNVLCVNENWIRSIFPFLRQVPILLLWSIRFKKFNTYHINIIKSIPSVWQIFMWVFLGIKKFLFLLVFFFRITTSFGTKW